MVASTLASSGDVFTPRRRPRAGRPGDSVRPQALRVAARLGAEEQGPADRHLQQLHAVRRRVPRDRGARARRGQSPRRGRASQRSGAEAVSPGARLLPARHGGAVPGNRSEAARRIRRRRSRRRRRKTCRCSTGRRRRGARRSPWRSTSPTSASTFRPCARWPTGPRARRIVEQGGAARDVHLARQPARGARRLDRTGARALQARRGAAEGVVSGTLRRAGARASPCRRRIGPSSSRC